MRKDDSCIKLFKYKTEQFAAKFPQEFVLNIPSIEEQRKIGAKMLLADEIKMLISYREKQQKNELPKSWLLFTEGYETPSPEEIRSTFKPFTGSQVAKMLGISDSRTIRKWTSGESEIHYANWRLFLIKTGRVIEPPALI